MVGWRRLDRQGFCTRSLVAPDFFCRSIDLDDPFISDESHKFLRR